MQLNNLVSPELLRPIPENIGKVDGWRDTQSPLFNPVAESNEPLVEVVDIRVESAYAPGAQYVRKTVAEKLRAAQKLLPIDFELVLFDGWRSRATQHALYEIEYAKQNDHQETQKYVSLPSDNPVIPAPHNTGGAVDVALFYRGKMLNFGTKFDHMMPESHLAYYEQNDTNREARDNRRLLFAVMTHAGFTPYEHEWWHFNDGNQMAVMAQYHETGKRTPAIYGATSPDVLE